MRADDLKPRIFRSKLLSNRKGDDCCKVTSEVIFLSSFQFPVLDLFQLLVTMLGEMLGEPLNGMIGGDCMVDEPQKTMGEVTTTSDERLHNIFND